MSEVREVTAGEDRRAVVAGDLQTVTHEAGPWSASYPVADFPSGCGFTSA